MKKNLKCMMYNKRNILMILLLYFILTFIVTAQNDISKYNANFTLIENISYYETSSDDYINERCKLDLLYPVEQKDFTTVIWFHGGGLSGGEKHFPKTLINNDFAVVSVNYRLHPKVKAPAYIQDAAAAIAWVFKNIKNYGGNPSRIIISGFSAGGYLAMITSLDKILDTMINRLGLVGR